MRKAWRKFRGEKVIFVRNIHAAVSEKISEKPLCLRKQILLIYSMWQGYWQTSAVQKLLTFCNDQKDECGQSALQRTCLSQHDSRIYIRWLEPESAHFPIHSLRRRRPFPVELLHPNCFDAARRRKMEVLKMLEGWLAILSVIGVVSFGVYYNSWLQRTRGCFCAHFLAGDRRHCRLVLVAGCA